MDKDVINNPKLIGKNLKKLRVIHEKKIETVAKAASLSPAMISNAESGKARMAPMTMRRLLKVYNFSLGLFISKIQDEIPEFDLNPNRIVQTSDQFLLLDGKRSEDSFSIKLMRPIDSLDDNEYLKLDLDPEQIWPDDKLCENTKIRGIVEQGEFLIEFDNDEHRVKKGQEFQFDGNIPHKYRNFTKERSVINLIFEKSLL